MIPKHVPHPQAYPSEHLGYGAAPLKRRKSVNVVSVLLFVLVPWALFVLLFSVSCFYRFDHPGVYVAAYLLSFAFILVTFGRGALTTQFRPEKRQRIQDQGQRFSQGFVGLVTMSVAYLMAFFAGNINYTHNLRPWFEMTNLQTYSPVDVATARGQQHMDAGRMYFTETAKVDTGRMKAFKSGGWYCVAPIVSSETDADSSHDFWAAGRDCCGSGEWHCGQWNNPKAHAGLRVPLRDSVDYYRLAVKQAQISFGLKVENPIFLTWLQNPETEIIEYIDAGKEVYRAMVVVAGVVNVVLVVVLYFLMFARLSVVWSQQAREEEFLRMREAARRAQSQSVAALRFAEGER